jgi:hypothetical protein
VFDDGPDPRSDLFFSGIRIPDREARGWKDYCRGRLLVHNQQCMVGREEDLQVQVIRCMAVEGVLLRFAF